ncbi:50S ribosomal protein L13 [archaeon]|nr:50S ribosomal protein L13 [archaeon]|tara:strand:+ start:3988 stop:4401 length:414 start_codon:yes stop_codon:yes gene_type:complete
MIIDAKNLILGRMASFVAKKALLGEKIDVVNCEEAIITGSKKAILAKHQQKRERGEPFHGPFFPKREDRIVKRAIRNMLPYKKERGEKALKNIKCHTKVPNKFKNERLETIESANVSKIKNLKYMKIKEISDFLGRT